MKAMAFAAALLALEALGLGCRTEGPRPRGEEVALPNAVATASPASPTSPASPAALLARPVRELRVPRSYTKESPSPLLVVLHGYGSDGPGHAQMFDIGALAERDRVIVVAPDGTPDAKGNRFWNAVPACCDFDHRAPDDVAYLREVIADVRARYTIDPRRIYAVGHSNGGAMALRLACDAADVLASVSSLAGPFYTDTGLCKPSAAVAVQLFHGTRDKVVPYEGGLLPIAAPTNPPTLGATRTASFFAGSNGCGAASEDAGARDLDLARPDEETRVTRWNGCRAGAGVELWTVAGMGHAPSRPSPAWPGYFYGFLSGHPKP